MYIAYLFLLGLAIASNSILIYMLYRYSQHGNTIVSFIVFLCLTNLWIIPKFLTNAFHASGFLFETFSRISALGYVFFPVSFLVFALSYTMNQKIFYRFTFWLFLMLPPFIFLYLIWTTEIVSIHSYAAATVHPWGYETPTGVLFPLFVFWFESMMFLSIAILIHNYRHTHEVLKKNQTFFVILAVIVPLIVGTFTNGILPLLDIFVFPAGALLSSITATFIVFAIFRYGLFEVTPFTVLSSINHAIITVDSKGKILQMNPFSERILGAKAANAIGATLEEMLLIQGKRKDRGKQFKSILHQVFDKGKSMTLDSYTVVNNKRHTFPYTISITPVYSQKRIVGASIFLKDMKREREREKLKDDFVSMVSHELRTPITSIKAYNQLLLKEFTDSSDVKRQIVTKMDYQLERLTRLIEDFFELSRMQSGKLHLKREFFRMDDLVHEVADTLLVSNKQWKLTIKGATNAVVFADKDRIAQVVINFITNAIKYSQGSKEVHILLSNDSRFVTVGVRDYGRGIPAEYHKKIFNRFYQIEGSPQGRAGLGIGLFISSTIVKFHSGKIWVDSQEGKGSTFYFSLPVSN